ncbi:MAG: hypothetical protein U0R44_05980 [Candidatus Micrarchaeia archaeon]
MRGIIMVDNGRRNLFKQVGYHIKEHYGQYLSTGIMVAAAAAVIMTRDCGGGFSPSGPMAEPPVRGDGFCDEREAYPYELDRQGRVRSDDQGRPVRNRFYSKEDCHDGDNVCDDGTDRAQIKDPNGNTITDFMRNDAFGREIRLPLEDSNSIDCILRPAREQPCGAFAPGQTPVDRPRITEPAFGQRQRSQPELERFMATHPAIVRPYIAPDPAAAAAQGGPRLLTQGNYYVVLTRYQETCNQALPVCTPESLEACWCPNIMECARPPAPPPRTCGNGRADPGEQCDPRSRSPRGGCSEGNRCTNRCTCTPVPQTSVCGNGRVETGEDCDPPGATCQGNGTCNSTCGCDVPPPPPPQPTDASCPTSARTQALIGRVTNTMLSNAQRIRDALGTDQVINARVTIRVDTSGTPTVAGYSPANVPNVVDLTGIQVGAVDQTCTFSMPVQIPPL